MKRTYYALGTIAGVAVTVVFAVYVWHALQGRDLVAYANPRALAAILVSALIYCCCVPLTSLAWQVLLRGVGTHRSWRELTAILGTTQIAKYIPGNVGQFLGRAAFSLKRGIGARPLTVTILLEIILAVAAAFCVGVCTGMLSAAGLAMVQTKSLQLVFVACVLVIAGIGALTFRRVAPRLLRRFVPKKAHLLEGDLLPPRGSIARAFLLYCGTSLCVGIALIFLAHIFLPSAPHENWLLLASFSLAWIVGFVTPGAPAGLGVREGLLLLMLGPVYGTALAGVLIIALRIVTTLGDLLWCAGGLLLLPPRLSSVECGTPKLR